MNDETNQNNETAPVTSVETAPGEVKVTLKGAFEGSYTAPANSTLASIPGMPSLQGYTLRNPKGHMMSASKPLEAGEYVVTASEMASGG